MFTLARLLCATVIKRIFRQPLASGMQWRSPFLLQRPGRQSRLNAPE